MIKIIYTIIISYFILGGLGFYFINRHKDPDIARKSYVKFAAYLIIIHVLFFSIVINHTYFRLVSLLIIGVGFGEMLRLFIRSAFKHPIFYVGSFLLYAILSIGLYFYSGLSKEIILFSFLVLSIFDSFSQITGQLWGKTKLFPTISPNKTIGGLVGGGVIATASSLLLSGLYDAPIHQTVMLVLGIVFSALLGDLAASYFKRKYKVKDYSNLIPGHGGFLDRFDSLLAGGAWVALYFYVFNF